MSTDEKTVALRTMPPTDEEIDHGDHGRILAWMFVSENAIKHGLEARSFQIRSWREAGVRHVRVLQFESDGDIGWDDIKTEKGYWYPIYLPSEWSSGLVRGVGLGEYDYAKLCR